MFDLSCRQLLRMDELKEIMQWTSQSKYGNKSAARRFFYFVLPGFTAIPAIPADEQAAHDEETSDYFVGPENSVKFGVGSLRDA